MGAGQASGLPCALVLRGWCNEQSSARKLRENENACFNFIACHEAIQSLARDSGLLRGACHRAARSRGPVGAQWRCPCEASEAGM